MSKETPPVIVPIKEGEEETRVIVFDADTWHKTGDLKGNESLYLPATVIAERLSDGGEPLLDVRFDDGRISRGHFKSLVKFVSPLPPTVSDREGEEKKEYILCSAIWYKDLFPIVLHHCKPKNIDKGIVLCGWRHGDIIAQMIELKGLRTVNNGENAVGDYEQGFLTNTNRFVGRKEAFQIARIADQINGPNKGDMDNAIGLTSEDIY